MPGAVVTGWGIAVPDKVVTNEDLSARLDTSDAVDHRAHRDPRAAHRGHHVRAGHRGRSARPWRAPGAPATTSTCSCSPPPHPTRSCRAPRPPSRRGSGVRGGAFDVNAACSGFVYALVAAHGLVLAGARRVLVIGSETLSQITDWDDRSIAVLVGRRGRRGAARGHRRARASCWPGTSVPTGRCAISSSATTAGTST